MPSTRARTKPEKPARTATPAPDLTFREFQSEIRNRYFKTDSARGVAGTFLLLMEEVGELATALHDNRAVRSPSNPMGKKRPITAQERANLEEEFADVFAWLMTIANIHAVDLDSAIRAKYYTPGRVKGIKY